MDDPSRLTIIIGLSLVCMVCYAIAVVLYTAFHCWSESDFQCETKEENNKVSALFKRAHALLEQSFSVYALLKLLQCTWLVLYGATIYKLSLLLFEKKEGVTYVLYLVCIYVAAIAIIVLFGNLLPKRITSIEPEKKISWCLPMIEGLLFLLKPFVVILFGGSTVIVRMLGIKAADEEDNVTEEEIMQMVSEGQEQGVVKTQEAEMITNIFEFGDKEAKDIMNNRQNIVAIPADMELKEAIDFMLNEKYSRFPVYEEDIDNIVGVLHLKDAMKSFMEQKEVTVKEVAKEPFFVHETQNISDLFQEMQTKKLHMAVVLDEYGQTVGIVAMEDILEVIVGNIFDEYDEEERYITNLGKKDNYLVRGVTRLDELEDLLQISFPDEDFDTINGFLIFQLGRFPEEHEEIEIKYEGYSFKPIDIHDKMMKQIKISKLEEGLANL